MDTHFGPTSARRFGWTTQTDPDKVESEVGSLFRARRTMLSHRLILARPPGAPACARLRRLRVARCPSYGIGPTDPEVARALVKPGPSC